MNYQHDKAKRWQFNLGDLFVLMILAALPIAFLLLSLQTDPPVSNITFLTSVALGGGVLGGMVGWTCAGTKTGFCWGYGIGGPCVLIAGVAAILYFMFHLPG